MRRTLTLDDDVAQMVDEEMRRSGETFKGVVNGLIRDGMEARCNPQKRKRFVVKPFALGLGQRLDRDCIQEFLDEIEGPNRR